MSTFLRQRDGHVEQWTLNIPEQRNVITVESVISAIEVAVAEVNADRTVRCVILTGSGSAFSSGGNIKDMADGNDYFGGQPYAIASGYRAGIQRIPKALAACEVPIIAAVNGPAVGAGFDLALMCDLRIASTKAWFAESFVKLGLIPGDGGAWFLPRIIGHARATEVTLTGERIDAERALDWGLVSRVVEPEELMDAARELAERITANPPHAVRMSKRLLSHSQSHTLPELLELSAAMQALSHHTSDHKEAVAAAIEKRPGVFTGK